VSIESGGPRGHRDIFPGGARGLGGQACSSSGGVREAARTYSEAGLASPNRSAEPPGLIPGSVGLYNYNNDVGAREKVTRQKTN